MYKETKDFDEKDVQMNLNVEDKNQEKFILDDSEEFQSFLESFVQSIESFSNNYSLSKYDLSLMDLSQATDLIDENRLNIFNSKISLKAFTEVLESNDFINISQSIFENGITPLYLQLCNFIALMKNIFDESIEFFSGIDIFGALCNGIVEFDDENDKGYDFSPIFQCMNEYLLICAKKYNPILDCFFPHICDIVSFLTSEFPIADVLHFLIKVVKIDTLQQHDLSLIPYALLDEFKEEISDVQSKEEIDINTLINFAILFSKVLDKNPYSAVIFQNDKFGLYKNLINNIRYFEDNNEVVLSLIRFFSSYTRSISIIDESMRNPLITNIKENADGEIITIDQYQAAMENFNHFYPKELLKMYINPKIITYLSGENKEEIIVAMQYLQSLALINPNLLYNGFGPKDLFDICLHLIQEESNRIKLECLRFEDILINQNDSFFVTNALARQDFIEICTDAAESDDYSIFEIYISILNGLYNASCRMDSTVQEVFRSYIYDLDVIDIVENIYKTLEEGSTQDKAHELLVHLHGM